MRRALLLSAAVCGLIFALSAPRAGAQASAAKDNPLAPRFKGATVLEYKSTDNDDIHLPEGKIVDVDNYTPAEPLEGKIGKYKYSVPESASTQDVLQYYLANFQKEGFKVLFQCSGNDCRAPKSFQGGSRTDTTGTWCFDCAQPMKYLAVHRTNSDGGEVYAALTVEKDPKRGGAWLTIVEVTPEVQAPAFLNAAALGDALKKSGHVAVYGIFFDPGSADLGPETEPSLQEIATLLMNDPSLKLKIVGHTDNSGTAARNIALSKRRAAAVTARLAAHYKVPTSRLQSDGVGPADPVAPNTTKDGRAKNTRIELLKQ